MLPKHYDFIGDYRYVSHAEKTGTEFCQQTDLPPLIQYIINLKEESRKRQEARLGVLDAVLEDQRDHVTSDQNDITASYDFSLGKNNKEQPNQKTAHMWKTLRESQDTRAMSLKSRNYPNTSPVRRNHRSNIRSRRDSSQQPGRTMETGHSLINQTATSKATTRPSKKTLQAGHSGEDEGILRMASRQEESGPENHINDSQVIDDNVRVSVIRLRRAEHNYEDNLKSLLIPDGPLHRAPAQRVAITGTEQMPVNDDVINVRSITLSGPSKRGVKRTDSHLANKGKAVRTPAEENKGQAAASRRTRQSQNTQKGPHKARPKDSVISRLSRTTLSWKAKVGAKGGSDSDVLPLPLESSTSVDATKNGGIVSKLRRSRTSLSSLNQRDKMHLDQSHMKGPMKDFNDGGPGKIKSKQYSDTTKIPVTYKEDNTDLIHPPNSFRESLFTSSTPLCNMTNYDTGKYFQSVIDEWEGYQQTFDEVIATPSSNFLDESIGASHSFGVKYNLNQLEGLNDVSSFSNLPLKSSKVPDFLFVDNDELCKDTSCQTLLTVTPSPKKGKSLIPKRVQSTQINNRSNYTTVGAQRSSWKQPSQDNQDDARIPADDNDWFKSQGHGELVLDHVHSVRQPTACYDDEASLIQNQEPPSLLSMSRDTDNVLSLTSKSDARRAKEKASTNSAVDSSLHEKENIKSGNEHDELSFVAGKNEVSFRDTDETLSELYLQAYDTALTVLEARQAVCQMLSKYQVVPRHSSNQALPDTNRSGCTSQREAFLEYVLLLIFMIVEVFVHAFCL